MPRASSVSSPRVRVATALSSPARLRRFAVGAASKFVPSPFWGLGARGVFGRTPLAASTPPHKPSNRCTATLTTDRRRLVTAFGGMLSKRHYRLDSTSGRGHGG